ncbi:PAS domain S-box protein [Stutzerimonas xanthomarina]|uniref:PAS domain S-box protein n=1 Tax=Stutzerimonas xanthomarina TaxID=271420 RepID=UPI003AA90744
MGRPLAEIVPPYVKNLPCFHNSRRGGQARAGQRRLPLPARRRQPRLVEDPLVSHRNRRRKAFAYSGLRQRYQRGRVSGKENEAFITALLRSTAVIQFNLDGTVVTANEQFLQTMGYLARGAEGQTSQPVLHAGRCRFGRLQGVLAEAQPRRVRRRPLQAVDRHGREVWLEATYNPVHDTEGNLWQSSCQRGDRSGHA